jgi:hypothetical protein
MAASNRVLDFRNNPKGELEKRFMGGRLTVDGKQVDHAWFVDVDAGVAHCYVAEGGTFLLKPGGAEILTRVVHGVVRVFASDGSEL